MNVVRCSQCASILFTPLILAFHSASVFGLGPVTGAIVAAPAPPSVAWNQFQSNTGISLIEERLSAIASGLISVDVNGTPGLYDQFADLHAGTIASGTVVDVHLLHFDPVNVPVRLSGSVTFAKQIIGLSLSRASLTASDAVGAPGTAYPSAASANFREFEFGPGTAAGDSATISADRHTLTVSLGVTDYYDQVRVFTSVPEPSTAGLSVAGLLLILLRHRAIA